MRLLFALLLLSAPSFAQLEAQPTEFEEEEPPPAPPKLTRPPEILSQVAAQYPAEAKAEGREAAVILLIEIDREGLVSRLEVVESGGADFDEAAMVAASQFVFRPAEFDGVPGPVAIQFRQVFEIEEVVEEVPLEAEPADDEFGEGEPDPEAPPAPINLVGVVKEGGTNEPLEGVEVYVEGDTEADEGATAFTDKAGRFFIAGAPTGPRRISYTLNGYEPAFTDEELARNVRTEVIVYLKPVISGGFETVIRDRRARKEVSKITLTREEVKKIPGTFGDPIRVIENLPGLARAPFAGGALIVRGANPADTGVFFDSVPIPLLYHFGGLKSVVNAEFLEDIQFYPGGFGARYGRATAGVADVSSRSLRMSRFHGAADISVLDSSFFFGGPLILHEDLPPITVAAAGRRSYIDAFLPFVLEVANADGFVVSPVYWDYQLKAEVRPWTGHTFSLFAFGSSDDLKVVGSNDTSEFDLGSLQTFHRLVGKWEFKVSEDTRNTLQIFGGLNETEVGINGADIEAGGTVGSFNWGLRNELIYAPDEKLQLTLGIDYLANTNDLAFSVPTFGLTEVSGFPRINQRFSLELNTIERASVQQGYGAYVETIVRPWEGVQIVPGLRMDAYQFVYRDPDKDIFAESVGEVWLWNADPRLTVRLEPVRGTTLKGAVGVYRQPPTAAQLDVENGNPALDQPRAVQLIAGFEHSLTDAVYLDVQGYYTNRDLLIQSTGGGFGPPGGAAADPDDDDDEPISNNLGIGDTLGVEFLLRHNPASYSLGFTDVKAFGWIAYTLSRTLVDTDPDSESLVPSQFDQTHILTLVGQLTFTGDLSIGARFRLVSGNPTTVPLGSVQDLDTNSYRAVQTDVFGRLPAFHQLDVRIDKKFVFDNFSLTPYVDLLNIYNATNAETFITDYRSVTQEPLPGLTFIPNFGLQGEF